MNDRGDGLKDLSLLGRLRKHRSSGSGGARASDPGSVSSRPSERGLDPLVAGVLTAVTRRELSAAEQRSAEQIEARREALKASTRSLEYRDYGAGAPTSAPPSEDEAVRGRPAKQSLGRLTQVASKDRKWAALLLRLVRDTMPQRCLEMGAAVGISAAYQAAALSLNGRGELVALEGGQVLAEITEETFESLGLQKVARVVPGRFADTLPAVLTELRPDFVFIDGHHDGEATQDYFSQVRAQMTRGVVVLDDIDWSPGMGAAWEAIRAEPGVAASVDLGRMGVCVIGESRAPLHCHLPY